ncbi:MAG: hypothetical protein RLZZ324_309, partial [Candidatus Parcubacteria bacterium]
MIAQFLSPFANKRKDAYGGSATKRMRFLREVYAAVRKATGKQFPVTLRLSGMEHVPDGLSVKDTTAI